MASYFNTNDQYVLCTLFRQDTGLLGQVSRARSTTVANGTVDPVWPRSLENRLVLASKEPAEESGPTLKIEVKNSNAAIDELIGHCELDLADKHWQQQSTYGCRSWLMLEPQGKVGNRHACYQARTQSYSFICSSSLPCTAWR